MTFSTSRELFQAAIEYSTTPQMTGLHCTRDGFTSAVPVSLHPSAVPLSLHPDSMIWGVTVGFPFAVPVSPHPDSVILGPSEVLLCSTPLLLPSPGIAVTRLQRTAQDTGILSLLGDCFNRIKPFPFQVLNAEIKADKSSAGRGDIKSWISRSALSSAALVRLSWAKPTWHTQNWQTQGTNLCKYLQNTQFVPERERIPPF